MIESYVYLFGVFLDVDVKGEELYFSSAFMRFHTITQNRCNRLFDFIACFVAILNIHTLRIDQRALPLIILMAIAFMLGLLTTIINLNNYIITDTLLKPVRVIIIVVLLSCCKQFFFAPKKTLSVVVLAGVVNSIVIILQYLFHFFGITDNFLMHPEAGENLLNAYRKPGLMVGYPVSGMLGFISIGTFLLLDNMIKIKSIWKIVIYLLLLVSVALTARTALYLTLILISPFIIMSVTKTRNDLVVLIITLTVLVYFSRDFVTGVYFENTLRKMFANVINYYETGNAHDYSTEILVKMFVFPTDAFTLLLGNGLNHRENVVNSDVFFARVTWSNGVFYVGAFMTAFLFLFSSSYSRVQSVKSKLVILMVFVGILLSNMKGSYMFSRVLFDALLIVWMSFLYSEKSKYTDRT